MPIHQIKKILTLDYYTSSGEILDRYWIVHILAAIDNGLMASLWLRDKHRIDIILAVDWQQKVPDLSHLVPI